jgi:uncharacterized protein YceK
MRTLKKLILPLSALVLLSGCSKQIVVIAADELCKSWKHQTVSKKDVLTDGTASGIEGSNKARPEWGCEPGKNEAKPQPKTS